MKLKLNNKGMTLVEVAVVMVIFALLLGVTATLILSGGDMLWKDSDLSVEKGIGDSVFGWLENRVKYSTDLTLSDYTNAASLSDSDAAVVTDGKLKFKTGSQELHDVYADSFYFGRTIDVKAKKSGDHLLNLTVSVLRADSAQPVYVMSADISIPNLELSERVIVDNQVSFSNVLLQYGNKGVGASTYADDQINRMDAGIGLMKKHMDTLLDAALSNEQVRSQLKSIYNFNWNSNLLGNTEYTNLFIGFNDDSQWPVLQSAPSLHLKPYFITSKRKITDVVFYATSGGGNGGGDQWYAYMVYNKNNDKWYSCKGRSKYSIANVFLPAGSNKTPSDLYAWMESETTLAVPWSSAERGIYWKPI